MRHWLLWGLYRLQLKSYNLEYYLTLARQLQESGIHVLAIKDMAGLLKPAAATKLILRLSEMNFQTSQSTPTRTTRQERASLLI